MYAKFEKSKAYQIFCTVLFALVLIGLPLTTFPMLRKITGSLVAPFSAIPLVGIILVWLVPYLLKRGKLPTIITPIIYFAIFAVLISASGFFLDGYYIRQKDFFSQSVRALITLGIGLSFYITLSAYIRNRNLLNQALLVLYISGAMLIVWSFFEIFLMQKYGVAGAFPAWVQQFKSLLVFQRVGMLTTDRITAFAFEPSWYVLIFDLILFPFWLSAVFQRKSLFNFKLWIFQVEDFLLVTGLAVYVFSYPRIGLLALVLMLVYLGLRWVIGLYQKILTWLTTRPKRPLTKSLLLKIGLAVVLILIFATIFIGALAVFIVFASRQDNRFQLIIDQVVSGELFDISLSETSIILLARRLAFYERTIFWFGGWNIFAKYPFGVGLGNAGFYMLDNVNALAYGSYEIRNTIFQSDNLMNAKSLWFRLLAETGIVGTSLFLTWYYLLWRCTSFIQKSQDKLMQILGLGGKLFLLAYFVEGFSVDSFALPYQWVGAALISAGGVIAYKEQLMKKPPEPETDQETVAAS